MTEDLSHLLDRNVARANARRLDDPHYFVRMAERQTPSLLWIGCSDSRVTANDVLDLPPGSVFVHRNIANVVHTSDLNILSVLEFAVEHLQIRHVVVCGHYCCGGVARALAEHRAILTDHWLQPITMLYRTHRPFFDGLGETARLRRLAELNVEMQVRRLAATPIVESAWTRGQSITLHGWIYDVEDGLLLDLGPTVSCLSQRDRLPHIDDRARAPVEPVNTRRRHAEAAFTQIQSGGCGCDANHMEAPE